MSYNKDCKHIESTEFMGSMLYFCSLDDTASIPISGCDGCNKYEAHRMNDNVQHPAHYTSGGIECIDAIRASLGNREFADYCKGNIIKYLWRYRLKNGVEDLKKAKVYLDWMIAAEEVNSNGEA